MLLRGTIWQAEIAKYEEEQGVEERQRVAIIKNLHERAKAQQAASEVWATKVEESQAVADSLAKKVRRYEHAQAFVETESNKWPVFWFYGSRARCIW